MIKKTLFLLSIITFASCGNSGSSLNRVTLNGSSNAETSLADCSGYQSDMKASFGISTTTGQLLKGQKFAKLVAVDSKDGKMKVTMLPPDGENKFAATLIDELVAQGYTIRVIACRENPSSVVSGFSTTGVCNSRGPINLIGKPEVQSTDFASDGFTVDGAKVHSTTTDETSSLKPNFIMITAGLTTSEVGDIMIAFGRSPYYNGCYNK